MENFLVPFIFLSATTSVWTSYQDQTPCCGDHSIYLKENNFQQCENNQESVLVCPNEIAVDIYDTNFDYIDSEEDAKGKFVTVNKKYYLIKAYSPYYCFSNQSSVGGQPSTFALFCADKIIFMAPKAHSSAEKNEQNYDYDYWRNLKRFIVVSLYEVSGLLLAVTAVIYFILPQTQTIEEKCTFHLTLNQCLFSFMTAFHSFFESNHEIIELIEYCVVYWYLFIFSLLGFLTWSALLAYHMWRRFGHYSSASESKLMKLFLLVGYGIPVLLLILSTIHIYWSKISGRHDYYGTCYMQRSGKFAVIYVFLPMIAIQSACIYFFVNLHQTLWSHETGDSSQYSTSNVKKYKFRFVLNAKLLLITGVPVLLFVLSILFYMLTGSSLVFSPAQGIFYLYSIDGIIVFYILVIRRKRILRSLAEKFGFSAAEGWQMCPEEDPIESDLESENEQNRES